MKTLCKLTALAVIAIMALISCAPEAELSGRDWNALTADYESSKYSKGSGCEPFLQTTSVAYVSVGGADVIIEFPIIDPALTSAEADVLNMGNSEIQAELQRFMTFYPFAGTQLETGIPYKFINKTNNTIKVHLDRVPAGSNIVMHIKAKEYTYACGKKLSDSGDTEAGIDYYDVYDTLMVTGRPSGPGTAPSD